MKKAILLCGILFVFVLSSCKPTIISDDSNMANPLLFGVEDVSIEVNTDFDILDGIYCEDGDDGIIYEIITSGTIDVTVPGDYLITYSCYDEAETLVTSSRTITIWDYELANGFYNYEFGNIQTRLDFFSAAERYLMERQMGGINLLTSVKYVTFSHRFRPALDEYIPILDFDMYHGEFSQDDSTVDFMYGYQGITDEYTLRSTIGANPYTFNHYMFDTSTDQDLLEKVIGTLYEYVPNEDLTGFDVVANMASGDPILMNPTENDYGEEVGDTWRIPVRDDLQWYFHPDGPQEYISKPLDLDITALDFVETYKIALDEQWFRAISGGGDFVCSVNGIKGAQDYIDGTGSWEDVGFKVVTDNAGSEFIEITYVTDMSSYTVRNFLLSITYSPINTDLYDYLDSIDEIYGEDYTKIGYTGGFYIDSIEQDEYIHLKSNPNYHNEAEYSYDGIMLHMLYSSEDIFNAFIEGYLDTSLLPVNLSGDNYGELLRWTIPGPTTYRINLNRLGTVEAQQDQFPDSTYIPEPILANDDFVLAMYHIIDREYLSESLLNGAMIPGMYYFSDSYISDPEYGVVYRETLQGQSVGEGFFPETYGFNTTVATNLFNSAIEQLILDGEVIAGTSENYTTIELELITYSDSAIWNIASEYLELQFEQYFVDDENYIRIDLVLVEKDFPEIYYDHQMVGDFDLGIGGISGSTLCPICFTDIYSSDNRSGFTLNWGIDTSVPEIEISYVDHNGELKHEIFSYDAISSLTDGEVYLYEGREYEGPVAEITETTEESLTFVVEDYDHPAVQDVTYTIMTYNYNDGYEELDGLIDIPITSSETTITGLNHHIDSIDELGNVVYQGDYLVLVRFSYIEEESIQYENYSDWVLLESLLTEVGERTITTTTADIAVEVYGERTVTDYEIYQRLENGTYILTSTINPGTELTINLQNLDPNTHYVIKVGFDDGLVTYLDFETNDVE